MMQNQIYNTLKPDLQQSQVILFTEISNDLEIIRPIPLNRAHQLYNYTFLTFKSLTVL